MKLLKNFALALIPMIALSCQLRADDDTSLLDQVAGLDVAQIEDADINVESLDLDNVDVDQLADKADGEEADAIEACFRRISYCHSYYPCYSYSYYPTYNYCTPCYSYHRPFYSYSSFCYTPVVYSPVVTHYWGCY